MDKKEKIMWIYTKNLWYQIYKETGSQDIDIATISRELVQVAFKLQRERQTYEGLIPTLIEMNINDLNSVDKSTTSTIYCLIMETISVMKWLQSKLELGDILKKINFNDKESLLKWIRYFITVFSEQLENIEKNTLTDQDIKDITDFIEEYRKKNNILSINRGNWIFENWRSKEEIIESFKKDFDTLDKFFIDLKSKKNQKI